MDLHIYMWREASPISLITNILSVTLGSAAYNQIKVIYFLRDTVNLKIHGIAILIGDQSHSRFLESWYFLKQLNEIIVIFVQNESLHRRCQDVSQSTDAMCRQGKPEKIPLNYFNRYFSPLEWACFIILLVLMVHVVS